MARVASRTDHLEALSSLIRRFGNLTGGDTGTMKAHHRFAVKLSYKTTNKNRATVTTQLTERERIAAFVARARGAKVRQPAHADAAGPAELDEDDDDGDDGDDDCCSDEVTMDERRLRGARPPESLELQGSVTSVPNLAQLLRVFCEQLPQPQPRMVYPFNYLATGSVPARAQAAFRGAPAFADVAVHAPDSTVWFAKLVKLLSIPASDVTGAEQTEVAVVRWYDVVDEDLTDGPLRRFTPVWLTEIHDVIGAVSVLRRVVVQVDRRFPAERRRFFVNTIF
jgi:hypothetical protein